MARKAVSGEGSGTTIHFKKSYLKKTYIVKDFKYLQKIASLTSAYPSVFINVKVLT